jgi:hypothetical protein
VHDAAAVEEAGAETGAERHADCPLVSAGRAGPPLSKEERVGIVQEPNRGGLEHESLCELTAQVDAIEGLQLVAKARNARRVLKRSRHGDPDAADVRGRGGPSRADDPIEQLLAAHVVLEHQPNAARRIHRACPELDGRGADVGAAEVERDDGALGYVTRALITLHGGPRRLRIR